MKVAVIFILIAILAVGVFGFAGMNPAMDHESSNCVASLINAVACPLEGLSSAIYHISAYASFSLATLSSSLILLSLVLLALLAAAYERLRLSVPEFVLLSRIARSRLEDSYKEKQLRWLSRFENSPTPFCSA